MVGEQGRSSRWGKQTGDKEKKEDEEKIKGAQIIVLFAAINKKKSNWPRLKQIDLGWNKLT